MNCSKCGAKLKEGEKFCSSCGEQVVSQNNSQNTSNAVSSQNSNTDGKATASLVLGIVSFVVPCVGFITSIVGLILGIASKKKSGMRTAGIVLNAVSLVFIVLGTILLIIFGVLGSSTIEKSIEDEWNNTVDKYESEFENDYYYDDYNDYDD